MRRWSWAPLVVLGACASWCGPGSIDADSTRYPSLEARVEVLERYVTFRRTYEVLDFDLHYRDNGSFPPGPSSWDVRVVAQVPAAELEAWVPTGARTATTSPPEWVQAVPTALPLEGVREWYSVSGKEVGVDRAARIVAYRVYAN